MPISKVGAEIPTREKAWSQRVNWSAKRNGGNPDAIYNAFQRVKLSNKRQIKVLNRKNPDARHHNLRRRRVSRLAQDRGRKDAPDYSCFC